MPNYIQVFKSTDTGAPTLSGQASKLIDLLDACLVNGYATASVSGIVEAGTVMTTTLAVANATLVTGDYVVISGASPAGANGTFQITVTNGTTFTYVGPGSLGAITGTILYKKAGLQWTKPFTGTNKAVFRSADVSTNQFYCRVLEDGSTAGGQKEAAIRGYETMSDVDTGTGPFPTVAQFASGYCARKSNSADATARAWTLVGDGRTWYMIANSEGADSALNYPNYSFGHLLSQKAGDAYNTFITGCGIFNSIATSNTYGLGNTYASTGTPSAANAIALARLYSQTGGGTLAALVSTNGVAGPAGSTTTAAYTYPNPPDSGLYLTPAIVVDAASSLRGRLPGVYIPMHATPFALHDESTGIDGLSGRTLMAHFLTGGSGAKGQLLFDKTGPWA